MYNVIDAKKGGVTNVIDFLPAANATKPPVLEQFRVSLTATALSPSSLSLVFRCVRIRLTRLPLPLLSLAAAAVGAALAPGVLRKVATLFGGLVATALAAELPALPLPFGLRATLTLPVPGPFLTRILFAFRKKEPPKAIVDFLFLDDELRVQRTNQGNIFVQRRAPAGGPNGRSGRRHTLTPPPPPQARRNLPRAAPPPPRPPQVARRWPPSPEAQRTRSPTC